MKKLLLILLFLPFIGFGQGQNPGTAQEFFDINGVKTAVGTGGFMWDLNDAKYEVPQGSGKHSLFATEYWMGGIDDGGQLKVAAMTYRQGGNDFWSGPCSDSIYHNPANMSGWDRVWKINKTEIDTHILNYSDSSYIIPEAIENWPAHGDTTLGQEFYLAPFIDIDNNGIYDALLGDYPDIKGDQALYIIRNDIGNIHTETEAEPLGIEQHIMFYGYQDSCPAVHNTLFVNMKLYNRSTQNINDFHTGLWVDPDLGYYLDDYVGYDVTLNMGYCYNGDDEDEGYAGYGFNPPAIGNLCLQGPLADPNDGIDNDKDGMIDEPGETMFPSKFLYYNNDFTLTGNPESGTDIYNYLRGIWKDNVPMTYGGDGHGSGVGATSTQCDFMFPGVTDPNFPGQQWTEVTTGNVPADRRFLISYGPLTFESGGEREFDYAYVWAKADAGGASASVSLLVDTYAMEIMSVFTSGGPSSNGCYVAPYPGCTDSLALNYNPYCNTDDSSCCYIQGCKDIMSYNYNPAACMDDGSCSDYIGVEITRLEGTGNGGVRLEMKDESIDDVLTNNNHRNMYPTYKSGYGPINITVVDSINITPGKYFLKLEDPVFSNNYANLISYGYWSIIDTLGNLVDSSSLETAKLVAPLGLRVSIEQSLGPGVPYQITPSNNWYVPTNNGLIYSSLDFDNPAQRWLSGVPDRDDETGAYWGLNWIRAGSFESDNNWHLNDYGFNDDPNGVFEGAIVETISDSLLFSGAPITGGTWAPYRFASFFNDGPGIQSSITNLAKLENLNSVDIVITDDTAKWSRVCVVEAQEDPLLAIGGQSKMGLRQSLSVDKLGNADGSGTMGMGWFPGYAIDLETGERLNIIFSEDSWQTSENGNDMLWNPTSNLIDSLPLYDPSVPVGQQFSGGNYLLGGKHFIYVVRGEDWVKGTDDYINDIVNCDFSPNYDESAWIYEKLTNSGNLLIGQWSVFKNVTWVGMPLLAQGNTMDLSNNVTIKLRVSKPYKPYETVTSDKFFDQNMNLNSGNTYVVAYENSPLTWGGRTVTYDGIIYQPGESFIATATPNFTNASVRARVIEAEALNSFNPIYSFNINPPACSINGVISSVSPTTSVSCDGFAVIVPTSGTAPYSYQWTDTSGVIISNLDLASVLCNSVYFVSVTDNMGCLYTDTLVLGTIYGCTDPTALNYNSYATVDDGSCSYPVIPGCTDTTALNYDPNANTDDGSCTYCDISADLFIVQPSSSGACDAWIYALGSSSYPPIQYTWNTGQTSNLFNLLCAGVYTVTLTDAMGCSLDTTIIIGIVNSGCTDPLATNYDPLATVDDGTCIYLTCNEDAPTGLFVSDVIHNRATINWDNMNSSLCIVDQYRIRYRETGTSSWSTKTMSGPVGSCNFASQKTDKLILNLTANTNYEYQMKAWYCGGSTSSWSGIETFTTLDNCLNVGNLAVYGATPTKATFTWDASNGVYSFVRLKARVDSISNPTGADFFQIGGAGVSYGTFTKNKNNLTPSQTYRGQARTYCDPNGGGWKSLSWTPLVYWTQPTIRIEGGESIVNLEVYPNPSKDIFNISFTSESIQDLRVRVLSIVGEELIVEDLQQFIGEYTKKVSLNENAKGIYFLEIETKNGIINKKLILQ